MTVAEDPTPAPASPLEEDAEQQLSEEPATDAAAALRDPWSHISSEALEQYYKLQPTSAAAAAAVLASALGLAAHISDTRESVRVSMAMQVLNFARSLRLPLIKTGVLLNISIAVLQTACDDLSHDAGKQVLKDLLIPLTQANSKSDAPSFVPAEIGAIATFFAEGFFAHLRLYTFVFTEEQGMQDTQISMIVEIPHSQPFSEQVFTEEEWQARVTQMIEKAEAERKAAEDKLRQEEEAAEAAQRAEEKKQAEIARELELIRKPATLDEAIEKAVRWRVEKERKLLEEGYKAEIALLKEQLAAPAVPAKK